MEADGVRCAAACEQQVAVDPNRSELTGEPNRERIQAFVRDEHVRAEPDRHDRELAARGPCERTLELGEGLGPREGQGRPADPDRGEP